MKRGEMPELALIPEPQEVRAAGGFCRLSRGISIVLAPDAPAEDRFSAGYLGRCLRSECGLEARVAKGRSGPGRVKLIIKRGSGRPPQGYGLTIQPRQIVLEGGDAAGVYYAMQTLRQCLRREGDAVMAPCLEINDWPDLKYRAIHYDTKHHQPTVAYVRDLILQLASWKINVLVWEWEDKFAYRRHPEIGAPGAFTPGQVRAFARLALKHHVQLVPLVQGLGHVSFILKHPRHRHLREISDSNWEFCPLKDGSLRLLFDLWDEAIAATPGSEFIHIGCDETYELGQGAECGCQARAGVAGKDELMQDFLSRCVAHVEKRGRKAISWGGQWQAGAKHPASESMVSVAFGDNESLAAARAAGRALWTYAPNPGITPLFLPHFPWVQRSMWQNEPGCERQGTFKETASIAAAARTGAVEGAIITSWDDSGLHTRMWMGRFVCGAEFSWNARERDIAGWTRRFFLRYFGPEGRDLPELYALLQNSAEFYYDTFQRNVWHHGDVGKIHLPDFPRAGLEISNFWRNRYRALTQRALQEQHALLRAEAIIADNLSRGARNRHDLELMRSVAELMRHNAGLILMLGELEHAVCLASGEHFSDRRAALGHLRRAARMIGDHLADRERVFSGLVRLWERTRLPKGLSLPGRRYLHARDRARHFANRTADMTYLILDEQLLDLEGYRSRLKRYIAAYRKNITPQL